MDVRFIKLCPLWETCPRMQAQCRDGERVYFDNESYIYLNPHPCIREQLPPHPCLKIKPGKRRKSYICTIRIDLNKTTLENALKDVLNCRKKYLKFYYASEVDDYINRLKEMIKNDGRSSRES